MINLLSKVNIIDNSGGLIGRTIKLKTSFAGIGDIILISVLKITKGNIKKGDVFKAMIVRTTKDKKVQWEDNAVILIKNDGTPLGSRIKGPISSQIKNRKIRALAKITI